MPYAKLHYSEPKCMRAVFIPFFFCVVFRLLLGYLCLNHRTSLGVWHVICNLDLASFDDAWDLAEPSPRHGQEHKGLTCSRRVGLIVERWFSRCTGGGVD